MSLSPDFASSPQPKPFQFSVGAASPLWFLFAGAAASGAAYWWIKQWSQPVNLEAIMGASAPAEPEPETAAESALDEPILEKAAAEQALSAGIVEYTPEPVVEPVAAVAPQPVPEPTPAMEAAPEPAPSVAPEPETVGAAAPQPVEAPTPAMESEAAPAKKAKAPRTPLAPPPEA